MRAMIAMAAGLCAVLLMGGCPLPPAGGEVDTSLEPTPALTTELLDGQWMLTSPTQLGAVCIAIEDGEVVVHDNQCDGVQESLVGVTTLVIDNGQAVISWQILAQFGSAIMRQTLAASMTSDGSLVGTITFVFVDLATGLRIGPAETYAAVVVRKSFEIGEEPALPEEPPSGSGGESVPPAGEPDPPDDPPDPPDDPPAPPDDPPFVAGDLFSFLSPEATEVFRSSVSVSVADIERAIAAELGAAVHDLISRGLGNSTLMFQTECRYAKDEVRLKRSATRQALRDVESVLGERVFPLEGSELNELRDYNCSRYPNRSFSEMFGSIPMRCDITLPCFE